MNHKQHYGKIIMLFLSGNKTYFLKFRFLSFSLLICSALNTIAGELVIGDFENVNSFRQEWRAPRGIWGGSPQMTLSPLNATSGRNALRLDISGSINDSWPYWEYRFPEDQQDLSSYQWMAFSVYNDNKKELNLQGFFRMPSAEDKDKEARVYFSSKLSPGSNFVTVRLNTPDGVWEKDNKIPLQVNWKKMDKLQFFFDRPREDITLFLDDVVLSTNPLKPAAPQISEALKIPQVKSLKFTRKPELDGKLDENEWGKIPITTIDTLNNGGKTRNLTTLQVAYDDSDLYIGIVCRQNEMTKISAPHRTNDGTIWNDENMELFLQNISEGENNYYHFALNAAGSRYDAKIVNRFLIPSWDGEWQSAVFHGKDFWSCELRIPWRIFDFTSPKSPEWRINLMRNDSVKKEIAALSPTNGGFHQPEKFAQLQLDAPDLNIYCVGVENFTLGDMVLGTNHCDLTLTSRLPGDFICQLYLIDEKGRQRIVSRKTELRRGRQTFKIPFEQTTMEDLHLKAIIMNRRELPIAETLEINARMRSPLAVEILEPHYRNTIFGGQECKEIIAAVKTNIRKEQCGNLKIVAKLRDSDGRILFQKSGNVEPEMHFHAPAENLDNGEYLFSFALIDRNDRLVQEESRMVKKLPFQSGQVTVDKNNFLNIDNKPFFPILLYETRYSHLDMLRKCGFNTGFSYFGWLDPQQEKNIIDKYKEKGFFLIASIAISMLQADRSKADFEQIKPRLDKWIGKLKQGKSLLLYEILDEPNVHHKKTYPPYTQVYEYLKKLDPYHPVLIVQCGEIHMPPEHADFTDIYEFDFYPGYPLNAPPLQPMNAVAMKTRALRKSLNYSKPIWVLFQGYDRVRDWNKFATGRIPDYLETRSLFYSSIAEGATGLGFWSYASGDFGCMAGRPNWLGIVKNVQELNQLMPVILTPSEEGILNAKAPDMAKFHFTVKKYKEYYYIIAASTNEETVHADFEGSFLHDGKHWTVLGEERSIPVSTGRFNDTFERYQVHIYTNDPNPPKIANLAENLRESREYAQKIKDRNRDNILNQLLLKENYGIKVETPAGRKNDYFILDGYRNSCWYYKAENLPVTVTVILENPCRMNRIAILSSSDYIMNEIDGSIRDFSLNVKCGGKWHEIARVANNEKIKFETEFPAQEISAIQLVITKVNGTTIWLDEIEAYCD